MDANELWLVLSNYYLLKKVSFFKLCKTGNADLDTNTVDY